jgi:uncharacterized protein YbjT (DUF2867 family)
MMLVTGASGFLCRAVSAELVARGHSVAAPLAPPPDAPIAPPPDGGMPAGVGGMPGDLGGMPHDLGGMHDIGGMHAGGGRR